jgi:hypothetical protein
MHLSHPLLTLLISASATLAAALDYRLEDIQCRCLSIIPTDAKPTLCTYLDAHKLDWHTASSFASEHNLRLHFASQDTVSKVLSINRPLPSSVLESIGDGHASEAQESEWMMQSESRIVCGFKEEVEELSSGGDGDGSLEPEEVHFVSHVVAGIMVMVVGYVLAAWTWERYGLSPLEHLSKTEVTDQRH